MTTTERWGRAWRYAQVLIAPVAICALLGGVILWFNNDERYDRAALQEWLEEARNPDATLPELAQQYAARAGEYERLRGQTSGPAVDGELFVRLSAARTRADTKREEVLEHLRTLGVPATKMYPGLLLLFPVIYRLEVRFHPTAWATADAPEDVQPLERRVVWDSGQEPTPGRFQSATFPLGDVGQVEVHYQLHAWKKRQRDEMWRGRGLVLLLLLAVASTGLGLAWLMIVHDRETQEERDRRLAQVQLNQAERQLLLETARHAETERQLLEQRLATQEARRKALELESNLYANIGIMAGSYAHNIKNLLVRPNDLLRRCLERRDLAAEVTRMLQEVDQTLGLVTDRLQQILQTVRRDPSESRARVLDLNDIVRGVGKTWQDLAADRWQVDLKVELGDGPLLLEGDFSHLQQAVENLLFNARDATFERRNLLREQARREPPAGRRQALIQAAEWRGAVVLRTVRTEAGPALEVSDNGAGMSDEVRRRCTETHFSTKRDNAVYEGLSTGMGLGLSFVASILDNHHGTMAIESAPDRGTTFRLTFPPQEDKTNAGTESP